MHTRLVAIVALAATSLPAQQYIETFSFPNGPTIPGWTQHNTGNWSIINGRLTKSGGGSPDFLTKDGFTALDSVLDLEVFYGSGTGVRHGALTSRHPGTSALTPILYAKIQDNGGVVDLDRFYIYENTSALSVALTTPTQSAIIRLITLGNQATVHIDLNKDGIFDQIVGPRTLTSTLGPGGIGVSVTSNCQVDNWKYYDAVLLPQPAALPRIGSNYDLDLSTPSPTVPWLGLAALGNVGFSLGTRAIPVSPDFLAVGTFANATFGFVGATDPVGKAVVSILLPPLPAIVGLRIFTSTVTLDGTQPFGIGHISNEHSFVIQP